jgi:hypothetical protein
VTGAPPPEEVAEDATEDALLLPAAEDREHLIAQTASLIQKFGFSRYVNAPLVAPNETYFPDPWKGGEASVIRVARRLFGYAEMGHPPVMVEINEGIEGRPSTAVGKPALRGMADLNVWWRRADQGTQRFGAEAAAMRDPHNFVASMARAVTWAWMDSVGIKVAETPQSQRMVDVATVYLGFGVMTTEASLRHSAENTGGFSSRRTQTRLGLLTPRAMAFCLALQVASRRLGKKDIKYIERFLQPNKVAFLKAALRWLDAHPEALEQLGLPPESTWPPPPRLKQFTGPLPYDEVRDEARKDIDKGIEGMNEGKPVFRVKRNLTARLAKASMLTVSLGAMTARSQGGFDISMAEIMIGAAGLLLLSVIIGPFFKESRCSDPKCANPLTDEMTECPLCKGMVIKDIDHPKKRLEAEEEWEESLRGRTITSDELSQESSAERSG